MADAPSEVMIPVRDGTRLQSFVHLPNGSDPFPSLMVRCMYGTEGVDGSVRKFVDKGYAVLAQNVRGRHKSEGGLTGRGDFPEDGFDTIEWMTGQAWCNGKVGTFGSSALARVQTATALLAHPSHRAMCPQVLPYGMFSRLGGSFMLHQIPMWLLFAQSGAELRDVDAVDWQYHLGTLPVSGILDDLGGPIDMFRDVVTNPHREYMSLAEPASISRLKTPNLMVTGWYDHCGTGAIDFFTDTMTHGTENQKRNTHLVVGPWDHSCDPEVIPDYDFGPEAKQEHHAAEVAFFARHLKGDLGDTSPPPVRIFVMGKNVWRDEDNWPLDRAVETKVYLHSEGDVSGSWTPGSLSMQPPGDEPSDRFDYDPLDPVPTWGGANSAPARVLPMRRGPRNQQITLYRKDVLTYYGDPLEEPLEVTGPLKLVLFAASTAADTDFTAKLMDVAPDGNARLLSDGVVRARFRNGLEAPQLLTPNDPVRYEIDLWSTSNEFQLGHRIALAISNSNFPRLSRNLNTGGDNERDSDSVVANQTIFHDAVRPSHLLLPIVR